MCSTPATLTVTTTGPQAETASPSERSNLHAMFWLPALALAFGGIGSRAHLEKRCKLPAVLFAILLAGTCLFPACGGGSPSPTRGGGGTPPGTYTVTIAGTSGTTHSSTLRLVVQ